MEEMKPEELKQEKVQAKTTIEIPIPFAQELLNYLQSRPYAEVYVLVGKLLEAAK